MRPLTALRRAPALAGVALLTSLVAGGIATASTQPEPPADTTTPSSAAADDSAASETSDGGDSFDIPGGVEPEILQEGTWFTDDGRMWIPENTNQSDEKNAAFCDFLFGTPDEIAEAFGVDGLTLLDRSGLYNRGGAGVGYACGYVAADIEAAGTSATTDVPVSLGDDATSVGTATDDTTGEDIEPHIAFFLQTQPLELEETAEGITEVFLLDGGDDAHSAALVVYDDFDGEMIDADFADAWLTTARDRLA